MAVDMLNLSEADRLFLYDNMLTADDLCLEQCHDDFDIDAFSQVNGDLPFEISSSSTSDSCPSSPSLEALTPEVEIKLEPESPSSIISAGLQSQNLWSSEVFYPQISIPENDQTMEIEILETPPNTPPEITELPISSSNVVSSSVQPLSVTSLIKTMAPLPAVASRVTPTVKIQPKQTSTTTVSAEKVQILPAEQLSDIKAFRVSSAPPVTPAPTTFPSKPTVLIPKREKVNAAPVTTTTTTTAATNLKPLAQKTNVSSSTNSTPFTDIQPVDLKALKRQERMIKNRESAYLSRKRKKEYLLKLEIEVQELINENHRLRSENLRLKQKLSELEKENATHRTFLTKDFKKTTTCLMAVLFMLTMNLAPFSGMLGSTSYSSDSTLSSHRVGRSLLWKASENSANDEKSIPVFINEGLSNDNLDGNIKEYNMNISTCPTSINKTESLRLEKELRVWALRVEKEKLKREDSTKKQDKKIMPPVQAWIKEVRKRQVKKEWESYGGQNELQIYRSPREYFEEFLEAIQRRDDTFYFVSFSGDHLLLPATAHNKTLRPRMSLVMPAMTFNDTVEHPKDRITMMQIDCEVMDTKTVHVKESVIPSHLRHRENHTNTPGSDDIYPQHNLRQWQQNSKGIKRTGKHVKRYNN